jgi:xanthine dehydrogenase YagT iron-sulfur-binding subunit
MSESGNKKSPPGSGVSRRGFLKGMGTGLVGSATLAEGLLGKNVETGTPSAAARSADLKSALVTMTVNGKKYSAEVEPRMVLLDLLRDKFGLTGTKGVCRKGECGACTVILNGKTVYSCMMLAVEANGAQITTVEGLSAGGKLHPIQEKFIRHDALMCGFCTPGFEMSLKNLLDTNPNPDLETIKRGLAGNTCRCGAHPHIFNAALELAGRKGGK